MAIYSAPPSSSKPPHSSSSTSVNTGPTTINSSSSSRDVSASPNFNKQTLNPSEPLKIKKLGVLNDDGTMSDGWLFFLSCRCGTAMFPTLVWWKIKGVKIGLPETRISLSFQGVAPNLYAGQINTWTIFLRLLCTLDSHFQTILMFIIYMLYMVPDITFGQNIRVSLDVGCGVASFGAYLLSRNVITISVAPKDVHENQIQFALERGVPAMVAAFATRRLLYPSQAFDLIHCSRCRVNWTRDDGILLLEVNRMLRAGGYFVWAAQPVYKHEQNLEEQWEEMLNLTTRLCWKFLKKDGYVAIWQKPSDNSCYLNCEAETKPPLCDPSDDPDNVWYVNLKACISPLPKNGYGANLTKWPARLQTPPDRLQSIKLDAFKSRKELFKAESKYWNEIITNYVNALHWKTMRLRNVMDMRASFGGFAAALIDQNLDSWVMNVVPVSGPNTLPVIYDRGLIGVMHDWCEPFDTYPRTYDFLHASYLLSVEKKRCNVSSILLEMDRILRPGGQVYIRDALSIMNELVEIAKAIGWEVTLRDTTEGPHASYRVLVCYKHTIWL